MEEWKEYKIGDICSNVCSGGTPSSKHAEYYEGDIPWLNTKEINFNRIYNTEKYITEEGLNNSSAKWIAENSVIVAMYGATAGKTAISKIPLTTNQACCNLTIDATIADYRFVYYFLCYKFVELSSLANGGAQQNLNAQIIKDFDIVLPSLKEQTNIANLLSSLDDKIEVNRRINDNFYFAFFEVMLIWALTTLRNDNLEQQAQALFKSWFVDFEPFRDQPFVDSELGMIPKGWRVGTLNELGDIVGGSTPSKAKPEYYTNDGIAWLTPKDLSISQRKFTSKGEIDITQEGYESCSTKLMPKGSILFSSRAPIGYITIAKNDICTNQGFKSVIPKLAGTAFLYCFLKESTQEIENKATGSTFKEASGALMKSLPAIIPEKAVLDDFEIMLSPLFHQQEVVEEENFHLSSLRDSLLPRLMSGELKISEINM